MSAAAPAAADAAAAASGILATLKQLSIESRELTADPVATMPCPPDPCTFLRQHVATNTPVVIQGALDKWPALRLWSKQYLDGTCADAEISVELTPNGYGDAVTAVQAADGQQRECFMQPHSARMTFGQFSSLFFSSTGDDNERAPCVPYLSQQNSNLTRELPQLLEDVEPQLGFAAAAFGAPPDAVNLWIGDERASTTFHKDHYENLYCVLRGTKVFHLLPPHEVYRMGLRQYPAARYERQEATGQLAPVLLQPPSKVLWCPIQHPEPEDAAAAAVQHPLFFDPSLPAPLRVEVAAGEVLYLPAMWWHFVEQRACPEQGWCVAVNYWYDMAFDSRWAAYNAVEALARQLGLVEQQDEDAEQEV